MRKQELIQLHQLLDLIRENTESELTVSPAAFSNHDAVHVDPIDLTASRKDHREAIRSLSQTITSVQERLPADSQPATETQPSTIGSRVPVDPEPAE